MSATENKAVFLSYASQDAEAARRIAEALRAAGVEVWFDQNELVGGDTWDQKIRRQIKECALFVPVISAATQARREGYFRIEWKLAAQRTHAMADGTPFLLPVVIDGTRDAEALVPEEFKAVQWMRWPEREAVFCDRMKILLGGGAPGKSHVISPRTGRAAAASTCRPNRRWRGWSWGVAGAMGLATLAWLKLAPEKAAQSSAPGAENRTAAVAPAAPRASAADPKAVVVLPFVNLSGDPAQEYLSDGLTEEILNALARESDLRVVPRSSAFAFKGRNLPLHEIARALSAAQVVEGSVRRVGNRVRVLSSITQVEHGSPRALPPVDADLADTGEIFALQEKVARAIVQQISRRETTIAPMSVLTKSAEAYDAYLRGRERQTRELVGASRGPTEFYERAVALDPDFALAWARLAAVRVRAIQGGNRNAETIAQARGAIERALLLQPDLPEALIVRAAFASEMLFEFESAARDLAKAEARQPASAELRVYQSRLAAHVGDWETAVRRAREGVALDPQNGDSVNSRGLLLTSRGLFTEADEIFRTVAVANDNASFVRSNQVSNRLAWRGAREALALLHRMEAGDSSLSLTAMRICLLDAVGEGVAARKTVERLWAERKPGERFSFHAELARLRKRSGDDAGARAVYEDLRRHAEPRVAAGQTEHRGHLALALAGLGEREQARALLNGIRADLSRSKYWLAPYRLLPVTELYIHLGELDHAITLWQQSVDEGFQPGYSLRHRPELQPLRADARFQALLKRAEAWAGTQSAPKN